MAGPNRSETREEETTLVKISLNLPRPVLAILERVAMREHTSKTAVIRRAIEMKGYLDDAAADGYRLLIQRQGEEPKEVIFR